MRYEINGETFNTLDAAIERKNQLERMNLLNIVEITMGVRTEYDTKIKTLSQTVQ